MIKNFKDYCVFIKKDLQNNKFSKFPFFDYSRRFLKRLRRTEYYKNTNKHFLFFISFFLYRRLESKLLTYIPLNVVDMGLSIAHFGCIYVNPTCRIGKNFRIHEGVTIGATNGNKQGPILGDNVFIGSGAKLIGDISIANNVCIGAGAVVVKDIIEAGITVGGVPAKKISDNDSSSNLKIMYVE